MIETTVKKKKRKVPTPMSRAARGWRNVSPEKSLMAWP